MRSSVLTTIHRGGDATAGSRDKASVLWQWSIDQFDRDKNQQQSFSSA
jgi:hypothetical protein